MMAFLDFAEKEKGLPELNDDPCPVCNGPVAVQYGLAGGGIGCYSFCPECGIVTSKTVDADA